MAMTLGLLSPAAASAQEHPLATCFWEGPISTERPTTRGFDGRNFNFPEESATYWLARFTLPSGSKLVYVLGPKRVRYIGVATNEVARTRASLRRHLKLAGL